jgi:hypothetical protein
MAQTSGYRSRTWGRGAAEDDEEACGMIGCPGGSRSAVLDDGQLTEEEAIKDGALPGDVVGCSSSKVLLHLQRKMAVRFISSDGNGGGRWWRSTVSRAAGASVEAEQRARERERERRKWRRLLHGPSTREDKAGQGTWSGGSNDRLCGGWCGSDYRARAVNRK